MTHGQKNIEVNYDAFCKDCVLANHTKTSGATLECALLL